MGSGFLKGKIMRNLLEFEKFEFCYNIVIIFKDEEGIGVDCLMLKVSFLFFVYILYFFFLLF